MVTQSSRKAAFVVDARCFRSTLEDQGKNQRSMAKALGCEPAAVTRMLQGTRAMSAKEATDIAKYLGVDVEEVLKRAGMQTRGSAMGEKEDAPVTLVNDVSTTGSELFNIPIPLTGGGEAVVTLPRELTKGGR